MRAKQYCPGNCSAFFFSCASHSFFPATPASVINKFEAQQVVLSRLSDCYGWVFWTVLRAVKLTHLAHFLLGHELKILAIYVLVECLNKMSSFIIYILTRLLLTST